MKKIKIYVDLDGVMSNFVKDACLAHGRENPYEHSEWKPNTFDESLNCLRKIFGMTYKEFWKPLDSVTFWENLDILAPGKKMLGMLEESYGKKNIYFLSTPSSHVSSHIGKYKWIDKNFPEYLSRTFLAHDKEIFATENSILIDDKISNCVKFRDAGGIACRYVTKWNYKIIEQMDIMSKNFNLVSLDKLI